MKQNHILSLLQSGYTTIQCVYDTSPGVKPSGVCRAYTFKTTMLDLQEEDLIVVPHSKGGMKVVKVVAVHDEPKIDLDADFDYAWTICKVDTTTYNTILAQEEKMRGQLQELEKQQLRTKVLDGLNNLYGEDLKQLEVKMGEIKNDS